MIDDFKIVLITAIITPLLLFHSTAWADQQTTCKVTNFVCIDKVFYGREQPTKVKHQEDCVYNYEKVVFDLKSRNVEHLPSDQDMGLDKTHQIANIKDGAGGYLLVEYGNAYNSTIAAIGYSRDGEVITSYTAQNMSYDGYPSTALGICESDLKYSDW